MQIPLKQFEQHIDNNILYRGLSYFKNGLVQEPEEISKEKYEAVVEGSEDYFVQLTIKNDIVKNYDCNCPYDRGPICKHVVAVMYYLRDELKIKQCYSLPKNNKKNALEELQEMLDKISHEELKTYVLSNIIAYPSDRNNFLIYFSKYNNEESKEFYSKKVKSIINKAKDSYRYTGWHDFNYFGSDADELLEGAKSNFENQNYLSSFYICTALMDELIEVFDELDDEEGEINNIIDIAYDILYSIAKEDMSENVRQLLIDYSFEALEKIKFGGWDWHIGMLKIIALLIKSEKEIERILEQIDKTDFLESENEEAQKIKYEILLKSKGQNAAKEYLEENISNRYLRQKAIAIAIQQKDFDKASSLALEGVNLSQSVNYRHVNEWYELLLEIAFTQNDIEKIIEYTRLLFLNHFDFKKEYYQILKKNVDDDNWNEFIEDIIVDIGKRNQWNNKSFIASIYIEEEWWSRLLGVVQESPDFRTLTQYDKYLLKDYPNEIVDLYENTIKDYMKHNMGRDHYQIACGYIRRIINLGHPDKANDIIKFLRMEYPKRRALLEELKIL